MIVIGLHNEVEELVCEDDSRNCLKCVIQQHILSMMYHLVVSHNYESRLSER